MEEWVLLLWALINSTNIFESGWNIPTQGGSEVAEKRIGRSN